jgi:hypothetical protein
MVKKSIAASSFVGGIMALRRRTEQARARRCGRDEPHAWTRGTVSPPADSPQRHEGTKFIEPWWLGAFVVNLLAD